LELVPVKETSEEVQLLIDEKWCANFLNWGSDINTFDSLKDHLSIWLILASRLYPRIRCF
jgi:hypothetical protein